MFPLALLGIGAVYAVGRALASKWESDNEEEEDELERQRERNQRFLKMRRSQLEKNRRKKAIKLELIAREKELELVRQADSLAKEQLKTRILELEQFNRGLTVINNHSLKLPESWIETLTSELTEKTQDLNAVHCRCVRHIGEVEKRIKELNGKRFFFRCCSCHRKFAVAYGNLNEFSQSRKGMRKCCDDCLPKMKARHVKKTKARGVEARWMLMMR